MTVHHVAHASSIEDLEREMAAWVAGEKDHHDLVVDDVKRRNLTRISGLIHSLTSVQNGMWLGELGLKERGCLDEVIDSLQHKARWMRPPTCGLLRTTIKTRKVVVSVTGASR